jgi:hypothetical protein
MKIGLNHLMWMMKKTKRKKIKTNTISIENWMKLLIEKKQDQKYLKNIFQSYSEVDWNSCEIVLEVERILFQRKYFRLPEIVQSKSEVAKFKTH